MHPIPESALADQLYGPFIYEDADLLERLVELGDEVRAISPDCVGLSLSLNEHGVPFTVVSSSAGSALRDAPTADRGKPGGHAPARESAPPDPVRAQPEDDPLDEASWAAYASAMSTAVVASTLSLPLWHDGTVIGGYYLYGGSATTFDGHHAELARVLGTWAEGAVSNADLDFSTLDLARHAPQVLRDSIRLTLASALVAKQRGLTLDAATEALRAAAERAQVGLPSLVDGMIEVLNNR